MQAETSAGNVSMTRYCAGCKQEFDCNIRTCPKCGEKLQKRYTKEELKELEVQDELVAIVASFST